MDRVVGQQKDHRRGVKGGAARLPPHLSFGNRPDAADDQTGIIGARVG